MGEILEEPLRTEARQRILDAAVEVIDIDGDASLRVTDIADRAGVAPGLINHHFGSRDGLVAVAQAERFVSSVVTDFKGLVGILESDDSDHDTSEALRVFLSAAVRRKRAENRMRRTTALASAHGRPALRARISETVGLTIDGAANVVALGQARGLFQPDMDVRAAGTVMLSMGLGYVIADFDVRPASEADLADVVNAMLDGVFLADD